MHSRHIPCNLNSIKDRLRLSEDGVDFLQRSSGRLGVEEIYDWDEGGACDGIDYAEELR